MEPGPHRSERWALAHIRRLANMSYGYDLTTNVWIELRVRVFLSKLYIRALEKNAGKNFAYVADMKPTSSVYGRLGSMSNTRFPDRKKIVQRFVLFAFEAVHDSPRIHPFAMYCVLDKTFQSIMRYVMSTPMAYRPWTHPPSRKKRSLSTLGALPDDLIDQILFYLVGGERNWLRPSTHDTETFTVFVGVTEPRIIGWKTQFDNLVCYYQLSVQYNVCWAARPNAFSNRVKRILDGMPELSTSIVFGDLPLDTLAEYFDVLQPPEHLLFISPAKACWISKAAEHFGLRFNVPVGAHGLGVSNKNISLLSQLIGGEMELCLAHECTTVLPYTSIRSARSEPLTKFMALTGYKLRKLFISPALSRAFFGEYRSGICVFEPVLSSRGSNMIKASKPILHLRLNNAYSAARAVLQALTHSVSIPELHFGPLTDLDDLSFARFDRLHNSLVTLKSVSPTTAYYLHNDIEPNATLAHTFKQCAQMLNLRAKMVVPRGEL